MSETLYDFVPTFPTQLDPDTAAVPVPAVNVPVVAVVAWTATAVAPKNPTVPPADPIVAAPEAQSGQQAAP